MYTCTLSTFPSSIYFSTHANIFHLILFSCLMPPHAFWPKISYLQIFKTPQFQTTPGKHQLPESHALLLREFPIVASRQYSNTPRILPPFSKQWYILPQPIPTQTSPFYVYCWNFEPKLSITNLTTYPLIQFVSALVQNVNMTLAHSDTMCTRAHTQTATYLIYYCHQQNSSASY